MPISKLAGKWFFLTSDTFLIEGSDDLIIHIALIKREEFNRLIYCSLEEFQLFF